MVYLIYGRDVAKINYYLDKIKRENLNAEEISFNNPTLDENFLITNLYTPPLLTNSRILILENLKTASFSRINFAKINPKVNLVAILPQDFKPKLTNFANFEILEARKNPEIFRFLDNLIFESEKINLERILRILKVEDPFFVFYSLISHFRRLILAKYGSSIGGLAYWQVVKYQKICQRTEISKLKIAYKLLLVCEISVKTQTTDLLTSLPVLTLRLTQLFKNA